MNDTELISQYLGGELDTAAVKGFEERLQTDPEFAETFRLYQLVEQEMQQPADEKALREDLASLSGKHFSETTGKKNSTIVITARRWWIAAAAACLLIGLFLFKPWQPHSLTLAEVYNRHALPEELPVTSRGKSTDSLEHAAALHYNQKNFTTALPLLKEMVLLDTANAQWKMALSISYLQTGDYNHAMTGFEKLAGENSIYKNEALLWQALTWLKQDNKINCTEVLKKIPPQTSAGEEAKKMLKELGE